MKRLINILFKANVKIKIKIYMKYAFCIAYCNNIYLTAVHHPACFQSCIHHNLLQNWFPVDIP